MSGGAMPGIAFILSAGTRFARSAPSKPVALASAETAAASVRETRHVRLPGHQLLSNLSSHRIDGTLDILSRARF